VSSLRHNRPRPRHHDHNKRLSVTRSPSTHSTASRIDPTLRPHPLIRGTSHSLSNHVAPLAPLTVTSETSAVQISAPTLITRQGTGSWVSDSPTRLPTTPVSPVSPSPSTRRTSISSARSVATLSVPAPAAKDYQSIKLMHDRNRTLSTISSSSSSSAAVSSLAHLPAAPRPATPQLVSFFPPPNPHAHLEAMHPLLPPPYLATHMTVLSHRTPLRESYDRVMRAKQAR
jgi:hypothetical protein